MDLERGEFLVAASRADMPENPLTRLPLVPAGLDDLDQRPVALLFSAYEQAGSFRMAKPRSQEKSGIRHYESRNRDFAPNLHTSLDSWSSTGSRSGEVKRRSSGMIPIGPAWPNGELACAASRSCESRIKIDDDCRRFPLVLSSTLRDSPLTGVKECG